MERPCFSGLAPPGEPSVDVEQHGYQQPQPRFRETAPLPGCPRRQHGERPQVGPVGVQRGQRPEVENTSSGGGFRSKRSHSGQVLDVKGVSAKDAAPYIQCRAPAVTTRPSDSTARRPLLRGTPSAGAPRRRVRDVGAPIELARSCHRVCRRIRTRSTAVRRPTSSAAQRGHLLDCGHGSLDGGNCDAVPGAGGTPTYLPELPSHNNRISRRLHVPGDANTSVLRRLHPRLENGWQRDRDHLRQQLTYAVSATRSDDIIGEASYAAPRTSASIPIRRNGGTADR